MVRPLIGISCYVEPASWGVWHDVRASLIPQTYVDHVVRAGGRPVVLPPLSATPGVAEDPAETAALVARLDGLVVAGGVDVDPSRYGQVAHPAGQSARADRDASELALVRRATAVDLPLLGVCRGMQVMAVAGGGRLVQHIPDVTGADDHSPGPGTYGRHPVAVTPGTRLHALVGPSVDVASYHHQGVHSHPGYLASAHAGDGILEAMEAPDAPFRLAVQWHPEVDEDNRLFTALVRASIS